MANRIKGGQKITPKLRPTAAGRQRAGKAVRTALRGAALVRNPLGPVVRRVATPVARGVGKAIGEGINRLRGRGPNK